MSAAATALDELKRELGELKDLGRIAALLSWDQQVMMPPLGAAARADQLSTLGLIIHERSTSPKLGKLIDAAEPLLATLDPDSDDARLVKVARYEFEKEVKVPRDLREALTRTASESYPVWVEARERSDFAGFQPYLEKTLELKRRYIECIAPETEPYDALLDEFEQGMTAAEIRPIFARLKEVLIPLVRAAAASDAIDDAPLRRQFPAAELQQIEQLVLANFGFNADAWRLDTTVHPFETSIAISDVRLSTRYEVDGLESLLSSMHEFGHGLYERQIAPELDSTNLARGASLGWHESQSLLWENLVGRGLPFWERFASELTGIFPDQLGSLGSADIYAMVNKVHPDFIRVEADETTYSLHVILRFELEQELLFGELALSDLPAAWNQRMHDYLGVQVPNDRLGVLQDVHWGQGSFGYFPTYSLGHLRASQLWQRITSELPDLPQEISRGEFASLREWLRENVHRHGVKFTPAELQQRVLGGPIDPEPFISRLREKLTGIYGQALIS
ncbi:MAG TPA: carboxypeptidase M32 [Gaiellaceae bacterium]|jgi:carboxypeptidase Taq